MITSQIIFDHNKVKTNEIGTLEIRIIYNRKAYYISTGVRVRKENFVGGAVINQSDSKELNKRLQIISVRVQKELNAYIDAGVAPDIAYIRKKAWMAAEEADPDGTPFLDWCEAQLKQLPVKDKTLQRYDVTVRRLRTWGHIKRWQDVSTENLCAWDAWLHTLPARLSDNERAAGKHPEPVSDAGVYNYHKCLKALLNRAVLFNKIDRNPYDRLKGKIKRGDRESVEYLTEDEMKRFMELKPPVGTQMDVAHDLFIFQMFTGLSYSDTQTFDISDYKSVDGKWVAVGERVKTGTAYISQLLPPVVKVLEKYGMTVPKISNPEYNVCLKALGMVACIKTPLHSHLARHTFATYMLRNGAKIQNVSAMLGHTNIKQTQRYAKVLAESVFEDFDKISEKLQ